VDYNTSRPIPERQCLLKEQGILSMAMDILYLVFDPKRATGGRADIGNMMRFAAAIAKVQTTTLCR
jgi:hypothetical protein